MGESTLSSSSADIFELDLRLFIGRVVGVIIRTRSRGRYNCLLQLQRYLAYVLYSGFDKIKVSTTYDIGVQKVKQVVKNDTA